MLYNNHKICLLFILISALSICHQQVILIEIVLSILKLCQTWFNYFGIWIKIIVINKQELCDISQNKRSVNIKDPTLNEASGLVASRYDLYFQYLIKS